MSIIDAAHTARFERVSAMADDVKSTGVGVKFDAETVDGVFAMYYYGTDFTADERSRIFEIAHQEAIAAIQAIGSGESDAISLIRSQFTNGIGVGLLIAKALLEDGREIA